MNTTRVFSSFSPLVCSFASLVLSEIPASQQKGLARIRESAIAPRAHRLQEGIAIAHIGVPPTPCKSMFIEPIASIRAVEIKNHGTAMVEVLALLGVADIASGGSRQVIRPPPPEAQVPQADPGHQTFSLGFGHSSSPTSS